MAFMAALPFIMQGAGSVMQASSGKKAQQQASQAESQDSQAVSQLFGTEGSAIDNIMQMFSGKGGAGQAMPQLTQMLMGWLKNPMSNPSVGALTTQLGKAGDSTVRTLQGDIGGVANPGQLATTLFGQAGQQAAAGGAESMQGFENSALSGLGNIFGQESGLVGSGLSGIQNMANTYAQMGQNTANNMAGQPNPFASAIGGLGGAAGGLFGPGGPWASSAPGGAPAPINYGSGFPIG